MSNNNLFYDDKLEANSIDLTLELGPKLEGREASSLYGREKLELAAIRKGFVRVSLLVKDQLNDLGYSEEEVISILDTWYELALGFEPTNFEHLKVLEQLRKKCSLITHGATDWNQIIAFKIEQFASFIDQAVKEAWPFSEVLKREFAASIRASADLSLESLLELHRQKTDPNLAPLLNMQQPKKNEESSEVTMVLPLRAKNIDETTSKLISAMENFNRSCFGEIFSVEQIADIELVDGIIIRSITFKSDVSKELEPVLVDILKQWSGL